MGDVLGRAYLATRAYLLVLVEITTHQQVRDAGIRAAVAAGVEQWEVAESVRLAPSTVSSIVRRVGLDGYGWPDAISSARALEQLRAQIPGRQTARDQAWRAAGAHGWRPVDVAEYTGWSPQRIGQVQLGRTRPDPTGWGARRQAGNIVRRHVDGQ